MKFSAAILLVFPVVLTSWTAMARPQRLQAREFDDVEAVSARDFEPETLNARRACKTSKDCEFPYYHCSGCFSGLTVATCRSWNDLYQWRLPVNDFGKHFLSKIVHTDGGRIGGGSVFVCDDSRPDVNQICCSRIASCACVPRVWCQSNFKLRSTA
ncbi:hypothetical protein FPV67DRAFT_565688 [Lyophyllum atratum]|nr:hypothetical protein FPV67DRAFT_565688 [Lyophyllum atratum]